MMHRDIRCSGDVVWCDKYLAAVATMLMVFGGSLAQAGDWPQILGPNRNGVAVDEKIAGAFGPDGPKAIWHREVGDGFAGVAVAQGKVVLFHREGDQEFVEGLDALTGEPIWKAGFPATYPGGISADKGPRCVPLIHDGNVYLFGAAGNLHSVALANGTKRWSRSASKDFGAPDGYFGAGSTPIIENELLLVNVGGRAGSGIVAFSLADGETVWKATDEQASYSSPTVATVDGVRHVIFATRLSAMSIDAKDGSVRWKFPFGQRGPTVNAATPLVIDGHVFLSASYGIGAVCAKIGKSNAKKVWENNDSMSSQYTTCVYHDGYLYGTHGRADGPPAALHCFEPMTGKVVWSQDNSGVANLILADGKLIIVKDDGVLALAAASPKRYRELGRAQILSTTTRALPALSNGLLYVRDAQTLKCVDLR